MSLSVSLGVLPIVSVIDFSPRSVANLPRCAMAIIPAALASTYWAIPRSYKALFLCVLTKFL